MTSLRAHRYRVKVELLLQGYPCPGCWEPITHQDGEFHHALFREGQAFTEGQKAFLYDTRNGTLVHHNCHMDEGLQFELGCAVMITQRAGGPDCIGSFIHNYGLLLDGEPEVPHLWTKLLSDWYEESAIPCPSCHQGMLHSYITGLVWAARSYGGSKVICWNCLWRNW